MSSCIVPPDINPRLELLQNIFKNCLKDDRISQRWLYETYFGYALKIAFRHTDSFEDASIVTNDSFVKAFRSLKSFEIDTNEIALELRFRGWLRRIVINTSIDKFRKNNKQLAYENIDDGNRWNEAFVPEEADSKLLYKELISYLKQLSPAYQKVFNLYVIDGYNHAEIAELLSISVGTSKSNLARARQILQKNLAVFFEINKV
jgi:RNA polymerase sigma-70 factor (ECF subfamily)